MKFHLEINIDNAAYEADPCGEVAGNLKQLVRDIEDGVRLQTQEQHPVRDSNGNYVGFWQVKDSVEEAHKVHTVNVTMEGGIIQDITKDECVKVIVRDYDAEGANVEDVLTDTHGDNYLESTW